MISFVAKPHELFDRFDPKYVAFKRRSASFRYPAVTMGSLLSEPPEYGAGEAGVERENDATPRYIRITDIDENGELLPGLGMTAAKMESQYLLRDGDLLFARYGRFFQVDQHPDSAALRARSYRIQSIFNSRRCPQAESRCNRRAGRGEAED